MQSVVHIQTVSPEDQLSQAEVDQCPQFQVIYLDDDVDHGVKVKETSSLQLQNLLQWLLSGGSVFISCKPP
jgi:hypothetical protein